MVVSTYSFLQKGNIKDPELAAGAVDISVDAPKLDASVNPVDVDVDMPSGGLSSGAKKTGGFFGSMGSIFKSNSAKVEVSGYCSICLDHRLQGRLSSRHFERLSSRGKTILNHFLRCLMQSGLFDDMAQIV